MQIFFKISLLPILLMISALIFADENKQIIQKGKIGKQIVDWVKKSEAIGFSGVVLAVNDGQIIAALGVGSSDIQGKVPNTPKTLFEIASATKQFTAAAVLHLVDRGKIKLDEPIATYLPGVPKQCNAITVRHLLQHTSGIPGTNSQGGGTDLSFVLKSFLQGGPKHEPGTNWEYWNQGYALLSEIIARTSKKSYVDYCKKYLFVPAKMKVTCFNGDRAPKGAVVAIGKTNRGSPRSALAHPYGEYGFQYRGMGGAVTNVLDLWKWHQALMGKLLSKKAKKELFKPGLNKYALGWFVKEADGEQTQSHGGSVRGFVCEIRRYPKKDACIFVLANHDEAPVNTIAQAVEEMLFNRKITVILPSTDSKLAQELIGNYTDSAGRSFTIKLEGKVLSASLIWSQGLVTRFTIGHNEEKKLMISDGDSSSELKINELKDGKAISLSCYDDNFKRKK